MRDTLCDGADEGDEGGRYEVSDVGPRGAVGADGRASEPADEKGGDG